jgi:capsular exopolysaccharide synthesis family protein
MDSRGTSLTDLGRTLRRHTGLIAACTVGAMLVVGTATALITPRYQGEASLRIGGSNTKSSLLSEVSPLVGLAMPGFGDDEIDTDMGVLRSRAIAEAVADSLRLHVRLDAPGVPRDEVLRVLRAEQDVPRGRYSFRRNPDGTYQLRVERGPAPARLPDRVAVGEPVEIGGVTVALAPGVATAAPDRIRFSVHSYRRTVENLQDALIVSRQSGRSKLVELRYRSTDPRLTAGVLNVATDLFVDYKTRMNKAEQRSTVDVLREQIAEYEGELHGAEERLRAFREVHQVVSLQDEATEQVKRLAQFQVRQDELMVERHSLAAALAKISRSAGASSAAYRELAAFPSFLQHRGVQEMLHSLIQLENERATLGVRRTDQSVDVVGIDGRIRQLEGQLYSLGRSYLEGLEQQVGAGDVMLARFGQQLQSVPERELEFARIAREQKLLAEIYTFLQTRLKEAEIQEAIELGDVRVVDTALVPDRPASPRPLLNLALAALLGMMGGATLAIGRESLDRRIRSLDDASEAAGPVPVLGRVPHPAPPAVDERWRLRRTRPKVAVQLPTPMRLIRDSGPWSVEAEAFRSLRASLALATRGRTPGMMVVTSAECEPGRAEAAANLALTFAQQELSTLLVDADLRDGRLAEALGAPRSPGLAEVLAGTASLAEAIRGLEHEVHARPLDLLPAGEARAGAAALLGSGRAERILIELRERYDVVIIDAPPLSGSPDAATLGSLADATVVFARLGHTDRGALRRALARLEGMGVTVGGVVLGDATIQPAPAGTVAVQHTG